MKKIRLYKLVLFFILVTSFTHSVGQEMPSGLVRVGGTKVFVAGTGRGENVLLFVHAGFQDHTMWQSQINEFSKDHIVLVIDLPGHGKTKDTTESPLASDVIVTVLDSLHIKKASLIGLSLGGAVVTDFALAHPDRVNKLVLASSGLSGWDEGRSLDTITKQYIGELTGALERKDTTAAAEVFTHYWFDGNQRTSRTVSPLLRDLVYNTTRNTMRQHRATGWPRFSAPSAFSRLSELKVPTLILTGTLDLPEVQLINGHIANNIPRARQVMIGGAGHMINLENSQRFNSEIRKFLSEK